MRSIKRRQLAVNSSRRRLGLVLMVVGLIMVLVPVSQYAHARIYYELVTRGIISLESDPALDPAAQPPEQGTPSGGTAVGSPPTGGSTGDPTSGGATAGDPPTGGTPSGGTPSGGTSGGTTSGTTPPAGGGSTAPAEPVWRIVIPKLKLSRTLVFGVTPEDLKLGPGIYPQGSQPGEPGNLCIAGHRNAHGSPFWYLDRLTAGDEVRITYGAKAYVYIVEAVWVTEPTDWTPIAQTDHDAITLTTCHPLGSTAQRFIVRGRLDRVL